jgi:hypothetical protein
VTNDDDRIERARRRGKRYVMAIFVTFAAAFIVSSTWQIVRSLFFPVASTAGTAGAIVSDRCAAALRDLEGAVDTALARAAIARNDADAGRVFDTVLAASWSPASLDTTCGASEASGARTGESGTPSGATTAVADMEAYAAALRLRSAAESASRRLAVNVGQARRDLEAFLPR